MLTLFYDTETTGLPDWEAPSGAPQQPHLVQLAAMLVDDEGDGVATVAAIDAIIRPDGWTIPDEVAQIHGITTEYTEAAGVSERVAVEFFYSMWKRADLRVAHNQSFDARIMRIALRRYAGDEQADAWKRGKAACTAAMAAPLCNIPPTKKMIAAGFNRPKTPKLEEAYGMLLGEELAGAHTALADCRACADLYWFMCEIKEIPDSRKADLAKGGIPLSVAEGWWQDRNREVSA